MAVTRIVWSEVLAEATRYREAIGRLVWENSCQGSRVVVDENGERVTVAAWARRLKMDNSALHRWVKTAISGENGRATHPSEQPVPKALRMLREPEEKVAAARKILADPEIAEAVLSDSETRRRVAAAHAEVQRGRAPDEERVEREAFQSVHNEENIIGSLYSARSALRRALRRLPEARMTRALREELEDAETDIANMLAFMRSFREQGSVDDALLQILDGEGA